MEQYAFWGIIERSRASSDGSLNDQGEQLAEALSELDVDQVVAFDAAFTQASRQLYSWEHWGARQRSCWAGPAMTPSRTSGPG